MPFDCRFRAAHGPDVCIGHCAAADLTRTFVYARAERPDEVPPRDQRTVDIALLDMHHGWPNLGHDALLHAIQNAVCDLCDHLQAADMAVRVVSYDIRRGHVIPEPPGGRHEVYVGTGGPGHIDPAHNDGRDPGSQGITEDPAWEPRLFRLFDAIANDDTAALLGVCHTFGVMCRWLHVADPVLRSDAKGGKSAGIVENVLTDEAVAHPWFARFATQLPDHRRFRILDNRLYDLIPRGRPGTIVPLAFETGVTGSAAGEAMTMMEVARARGDDVPRILGVNHHPEIINRDRQVTALRQQRDRGDVTDEWFEERLRTLTQTFEDGFGERLLHLTSSYTLLAPLRVHLYRALLRRADALGASLGVAPEDLPIVYDLAADTAPPSHYSQRSLELISPSRQLPAASRESGAAAIRNVSEPR